MPEFFEVIKISYGNIFERIPASSKINLNFFINCNANNSCLKSSFDLYIKDFNEYVL